MSIPTIQAKIRTMLAGGMIPKTLAEDLSRELDALNTSLGDQAKQDWRRYVKPIGNALIAPDGSGTNNVSDTDGVTIYTPGIRATPTAAGGWAHDFERYNTDELSYLNATADHMWALRNRVSAYMTIGLNTTPGAGCFSGIAFGENTVHASNDVGTTHTMMFLRLNTQTGNWQFVFVNQYGSGAGKFFLVDLGTLVSVGVNPFVVGRSFRLVLDYFPNDRIECYINDILVYTFTDANAGGGFAPLADTFAHETSVGLTLSGGGIITMSLNGGPVTALFKQLDCLTIRP